MRGVPLGIRVSALRGVPLCRGVPLFALIRTSVWFRQGSEEVSKLSENLLTLENDSNILDLNRSQNGHKEVWKNGS